MPIAEGEAVPVNCRMATPLSAATRVVVSQDQVSTNLSGEEVILSVRDSVYFGLDPVGARIWALMHQPRTLGEIANTVVSEYDVEGTRALADLLVLADQLRDAGLLEVLPAPTA